jgi:hypothetical protein
MTKSWGGGDIQKTWARCEIHAEFFVGEPKSKNSCFREQGIVGQVTETVCENADLIQLTQDRVLADIVEVS